MGDPVTIAVLLAVVMVVTTVALALWAFLLLVRLIFRILFWPVRATVRSLRGPTLPAIGRAGHCGNRLCGAGLPRQARFCPRCGRLIQPATTAVVPHPPHPPLPAGPRMVAG